MKVGMDGWMDRRESGKWERDAIEDVKVGNKVIKGGVGCVSIT